MPAAMPAFNTLRYADELKAAGVPDAQARITVQMVADVVDMKLDRLASKDDLKVQGMELRGEILAVKDDLKMLGVELRGEILAVKDDLKMLGMELRGEMAGLRTELRGDMDSRFAKVDKEFIELRGEVKTLGAALQGQINTLQSQVNSIRWMSGPVALVALVWIAKEALKVFGVQ